MNKSAKQNAKPNYIRSIVLVAVMLVALYVVVPRIGDFRTSLAAFKHVDIYFMLLALGCVVVSVTSAALAYRFLAFKRIEMRRMLLIQWSSMFVNRLLPAGIGGIGLFVRFFYRQEGALSKATAIVVINSMLSFIAHMTLVLIAAVFFTVELPVLNLPHVPVWFYIIVAGVAGLALILTRGAIGKKVASFLREFGMTVALYSRRKTDLGRAFVFSMSNTGFHLLALFMVMHAFGLGLSWEVALVVLTGGVAAATITPTPGGVAGSEAGITAVLIAYGIEPGLALAVALSYRLVSYWTPLLPGVVAFIYAQHRRYI